MKNGNPKIFSSLEEARTYYASLSRKLLAKKEDTLFRLAKINAEMENLEKNFREYSLALPLCDQKRYYISTLIDMERMSKKGAPENANYTVADIDGLIEVLDKDAARPISSISAVPSRPAAENSTSSVNKQPPIATSAPDSMTKQSATTTSTDKKAEVRDDKKK
jgi:hypothetical protein